ncbi:MAG: hypothetical protein GEU88_06330 [Solirubrobacterales bacterium]|nr:hypothetical protein [Solirubrobacterales bacterium]
MASAQEPESTGVSDFERLAYETALRGLDNQGALLSELRARTGILLAASSLAFSFLGSGGFDQLDALALALAAGGAVLAFGISIGSSVYILLPKRDLYFSPSGSVLYEQLYEFRGHLAEVYRRLAYELDRGWESNERELKRLVGAFRVVALSLIVEVVLLIALLSGTLV